MSGMDPPTGPGKLPADTAVSMLANEIRASILWTLSRERGGGGPPPVLSFSDLHDRAAPDVRSSKFNYHLQQLSGRYVERVRPDTDLSETSYPVPEMAGELDDGYRLTPEGTTLIRQIRAWVTDIDPEDRGVPIDFECHYCATPVDAWYEADHVVIQCPGCEYLYGYNRTPPGVFADNAGETIERIAVYNRHVRRAFALGYCPNCGSHVDAEFQDPATTGYPRSDRREVIIRRGCGECGAKDNLTAGEIILREPAVLDFLAEHGVDSTTPIWELPFAATDRHTTVEREPTRVTVTVGIGEHLRVTFDGTLRPLAIERCGE